MQSINFKDAMIICATLNNIGHLKVYRNTPDQDTLRYTPRKGYATDESNSLACDCLRKLGFTNVQINPEKSIYHCISATIECEYDLSTKTIKHANPNDLRALLYIINYIKTWCVVSLPSESGSDPIPFNKYLSNIKNYLSQQKQR